MTETKKQELIRTVQSLPDGNQRRFRMMYGRDDGNRSIEETLAMSIDDIVTEMSYRKIEWAQTQVYNTVLRALKG